MAGFATFAPAATAFTDAQLIAVRDGFDTRATFALSHFSGRSLDRAKKKPPLRPGRPAFVRGYGYSLANHALTSLLLGEGESSANAALHEYAEYFLSRPAERRDKDNFYWSSDIVYRCVEFFGSNGSMDPGRVTRETEDRLLDLAWDYCKETSALADAEFALSGTWNVHESENHHIQRFSTAWHFSKLLTNDPRYRDRQYDDGARPADHYKAWTSYAIEYFRERARKGLFVEISSPGYALQSLKGVHGFYDFAKDERLQKAAGMFLDLYWANWAQEQLDGVRGGGKTRCYPVRGSQGGFDTAKEMAWFHFGLGEPQSPQSAGANGLGNLLSVLSSDYRVPLVVVDIALDPDSRGSYEIIQRRMGLAKAGFHTPPDYRLRQDFGGILKYSYCTPSFIIGALMHEARPLTDWAMISSQNRWHGVVFRGAPDARLYVQCRDALSTKTYNQQWSVQCKGTLIAQRLGSDGHSRSPDALRVWFSESGIRERIERDGWVFAQTPDAFVAVRVVSGTTHWQTSASETPGNWLCLSNSLSPVIIEVLEKHSFDTYGAFQDAALESRLEHIGGVLHYDGLSGDQFTFYTDYSNPPLINGVPVDLAPPRVFESPFVDSNWNSGVVTIRKGERKRVLDFEDLVVRASGS